MFVVKPCAFFEFNLLNNSLNEMVNQRSFKLKYWFSLALLLLVSIDLLCSLFIKCVLNFWKKKNEYNYFELDFIQTFFTFYSLDIWTWPWKWDSAIYSCYRRGTLFNSLIKILCKQIKTKRKIEQTYLLLYDVVHIFPLFCHHQFLFVLFQCGFCVFKCFLSFSLSEFCLWFFMCLWFYQMQNTHSLTRLNYFRSMIILLFFHHIQCILFRSVFSLNAFP